MWVTRCNYLCFRCKTYRSTEKRVRMPGVSDERIMGPETSEFQPRRNSSFGRQSSSRSSLRRRSFNLSGRIRTHLDDDVESETGSQAGDIGDRALYSNRHSEDGSHRFSMDIATEAGVVVPITEDPYLQSSLQNLVSPVAAKPSEMISPLSTDRMLPSDKKQQEDMKQLAPWLEYASCMIYLSVFGILGVITRYLLQKLFGPDIIGLTHDGTVLYLDLPSNMVGSFLMGWFGVVFKTDIVSFSDQLAVGITTGYLGSLTTFSGWNQKMLDLSVKGHWVFAALGFFGGLFLAAYSIIFGIETAQGTRWLFQRLWKFSDSGTCCANPSFQVNTFRRHMIVITVLVSTWGALWALSVTMETREFQDGGTGAQLWLGCLVGPFGVWVRWWLARINGRGIAGKLKWIPFGTLIANVSAACIMAALATVKKAVNTKTSVTVAGGIQFGFLGCLSTVSTMMAEFNAMRQSSHPWRAYAYAFITIALSFGLGILIYSVPVWVNGYE